MNREEDRSLIRLIRGANAWYWYIPLDDDLTSVGLVLDTKEYRRLGQSPEATLANFLAAEPATRELMGARPQRVSPVHATGDYSYTVDRMTGDRWMMAGDAAGFIDPIFSTGVFLAIHTGEECANALDASLADPSCRAARFARHERKIRRVMRKYQRFVDAWYSHEFIEVFTTPTAHLGIVPAVNSILAGNVEPGFGVWWRLQLFYLVVYLQKFIPIVPRLTLTPPPLLKAP
jgi:flavin-dependent dehydrogenase